MALYANVTEYFVEEYGFLLPFLDKNDPFWLSIRENTISNADLARNLLPYLKRSDAEATPFYRANLAILVARSLFWIEEPPKRRLQKKGDRNVH